MRSLRKSREKIILPCLPPRFFQSGHVILANMDETLAFVIQLAQETGNILLDYYHSNNKQTNVKADFSVVTAADLAADSYISDVIRRKHPQDSLLSEELQSSLLDQPRL